MRRLASLAVLLLALPAGAKVLTPATTDAQSAAARRLLESRNGAGARGCLSERQAYEAYYRVDSAMAWNPDNPVDWYVGRNTIGLFESLVLAGYGSGASAWNAAFNGTDFAAIGAPCAAASTPRALAACLNDRVAAYFKDHPKIRPSLGGACKMYSATLVRASERFPAVRRQAAVVASAQHAFNRLTIRDAQGRDHEFLIDSLNNLVIALNGANGACPDEGTLSAAAAPGAPAERAAAAREAASRERQARARERVGRIETDAPAP
jgi:hypothetical protein